jgi:hypothetical protein
MKVGLFESSRARTWSQSHHTARERWTSWTCSAVSRPCPPKAVALRTVDPGVRPTVLDVERPLQRRVVQRLAGKLLGVRAGGLRTTGEWRELSTRLRAAADKTRGPVVVCADFLYLHALPEEAAEELLVSGLQFSPRLLRSALILPRDAHALRLQMERLLRVARSPVRRLCSDAAEAKAWLSSCLDGAEQRSLDEFFATAPRNASRGPRD